MKIKPSDIHYEDGFFGTTWQKCEKETIARNICVVMEKRDDKFVPFTWDEYVDMVEHKASLAEKSILDGFVEDGYLAFEDDKYDVNFRFIAVLIDYIDSALLDECIGRT